MSSAESAPRILVLHGSGVRLRGLSQKEIATFGKETYDDYEAAISKWAGELGLQVLFVQSNWEGRLIDELVERYAAQDTCGVIVNPAGFTWGYPALGKALAAVEDRMPAIEVHITNISKRPTPSDISPYVRSTIAGFGLDGYRLALTAFQQSK